MVVFYLKSGREVFRTAAPLAVNVQPGDIVEPDPHDDAKPKYVVADNGVTHQWHGAHEGWLAAVQVVQLTDDPLFGWKMRHPTNRDVRILTHLIDQLVRRSKEKLVDGSGSPSRRREDPPDHSKPSGN